MTTTAAVYPEVRQALEGQLERQAPDALDGRVRRYLAAARILRVEDRPGFVMVVPVLGHRQGRTIVRDVILEFEAPAASWHPDAARRVLNRSAELAIRDAIARGELR